MSTAGKTMLAQIDVPSQREALIGWKRIVTDTLSPLIAGDSTSVRAFWGYQCLGTHGPEFNEPAAPGRFAL